MWLCPGLGQGPGNPLLGQSPGDPLLGQSLLLDCEDVRTGILGGPGVARVCIWGESSICQWGWGEHFNILIIVLTILGLIAT